MKAEITIVTEYSTAEAETEELKQIINILQMLDKGETLIIRIIER